MNPETLANNSTEPLVTFSKFILWDEKGQLLSECAPELNKSMFVNGRIPRTGKSFSEEIYKEVLELLKRADNAPPSQGYSECRECLEYLKCFKSKNASKSEHLSTNHSGSCS